ncbi:MAG: protein kinase [Myxococcota bacterium]
MNHSTLPEHRLQLPPGTEVDSRFRISRALGAGGFASVYEAEHLTLERYVALKILRLQGSPRDIALFRERFEREAKLAARLEHPNVVRIIDFGFYEATGQPYIAMELLEGHDLQEELERRGALGPERTLRLFDGALDALGYGHERGVVHKDLKPSNLFIVQPDTPRERLVVLDYGIARAYDDPDSRLTKTNQVTGTPAYLAPEYIERQLVTPALDVYQMGLLITEAISGSPAVRADSTLAYLMAHCSGKQELNPALRSSPIGPVLERAMAVEHTQRYTDGNALRVALSAIDAASLPSFEGTRLEHAPVSDRMIPSDVDVHADTIAHAAAPQTPQHLALETTPGPPREDGASVNLALLAALGVVTLALVGVLGIGALVLTRTDSDAPEPAAPPEHTYSSSAGARISAPPEGSSANTEDVPDSVPKELHAVTAKSAKEKLQNAAYGMRLVRGTLDTAFHLYFGLLDKWGLDEGEVVAGVAPRRDLDMNFQMLLIHFDKVRSSDPKFGPLDDAAVGLRVEIESMRKLTHEMDEYYHGGAYKEDGHARGPALFEKMRARFAAYTKARDAFQEQSLRVHRAALERDLAIAKRQGSGGRGKMIETLLAMLDVYAGLDDGIEDSEVRKSKAVVIAQLRDARSFMEGEGMLVHAVLQYINDFVESWHKLDNALEELRAQEEPPEQVDFQTYGERHSLRTAVMDALAAYYSVR